MLLRFCNRFRSLSVVCVFDILFSSWREESVRVEIEASCLLLCYCCFCYPNSIVCYCNCRYSYRLTVLLYISINYCCCYCCVFFVSFLFHFHFSSGSNLPETNSFLKRTAALQNMGQKLVKCLERKTEKVWLSACVMRIMATEISLHPHVCACIVLSVWRPTKQQLLRRCNY